MKQYGYDRETGALFSWEFDFNFEGRTLNPPEGAVESKDRMADQMVGCAFLSGWVGTFIVVHSDGDEEHFFLYGFDPKTGYWKGGNIGQDNLRKLSVRMPLCVWGNIVRSPEKLAALCARFPNSRMYTCPLTEELAAFGVLVRNVWMRPHRANLVWDNKAVMDAEFQTFDPALDGDALGRMADLVAHGLSVVNEVKTTVGLSPFYGRTLHRDWKSGDQVIVRAVEVDQFFPQASISAKSYAATSVPVRMETTAQFRSASGYNEAFADVFVTTDYVPGAAVFMRFYKTLADRGFVFVSDQGVDRHEFFVPVFRSDKAYRVPKDKYEQTVRLLRREQGSGSGSNPA